MPFRNLLIRDRSLLKQSRQRDHARRNNDCRGLGCRVNRTSCLKERIRRRKFLIHGGRIRRCSYANWISAIGGIRTAHGTDKAAHSERSEDQGGCHRRKQRGGLQFHLRVPLRDQWTILVSGCDLYSTPLG